MVAPITRNPHYRLIPPATLDPGEPLQSAFNPGIKKLFQVKRTGLIRHPKTGRQLREFLLVDQFGNRWITYQFVDADFDVAQLFTTRETAYVKPSVIRAHGGLTADLFDKYRLAAFRAADRHDAALRAVRHIAEATAGKPVDVSKLELPPAPNLAHPN